VQVKISVRHGRLGDDAQAAIRHKADKLLHLFDRLTQIEVTVDLAVTPDKKCRVEFIVQAEHKHDFVAHECHQDVLAAVDLVMDKIQAQLRRYKEKIQDPRRAASADEAGAAPRPEDATEE
jgi:putative sigma-54 modulation protein